MTTIAVVGAGSVVFGKNIIADTLWHDALQDSELRLMDIDSERLETAGMLAREINNELGTNATIIETMNRTEALEGADFVISTIGVGGIDATRNDLEIPRKLGLRQTIGDTLGVGGIFRAARNIPILIDLARDMETVCPNALLINYSNPMAMNMLALQRATDISCVGICHGVHNTARAIRMFIGMYEDGVPEEAIQRHLERPLGSAERDREWLDWLAYGDDPDFTYSCAGINHMAFYLELTSGDRDLYPVLREVSRVPALHRLDPVRFDLFDRLGYFMTETSRHTAEYVPWFMQHDSEIERLELIPSFYLDTCQRNEKHYREMRTSLQAGDTILESDYSPSSEYVSRIINAVVTDQPYIFNGNVHNDGGTLIPNLPGDSCVEVACVADGTGIQPTHQSPLPPQCAAMIRTNINVQDLAVRGILEANRDRIRNAMMMDPNTAATLTLPQIDDLCDTMIETHQKYMPALS